MIRLKHQKKPCHSTQKNRNVYSIYSFYLTLETFRCNFYSFATLIMMLLISKPQNLISFLASPQVFNYIWGQACRLTPKLSEHLGFCKSPFSITSKGMSTRPLEMFCVYDPYTVSSAPTLNQLTCTVKIPVSRITIPPEYSW